MILCDTGPLVALIDADDQYHELCTEAVKEISRTLFITTWPCATEIMYFLGKAGGHRGQDEFRGYVDEGAVVIHHPDHNEWNRIQELMKKYKDTPMDFADASLVAAAETLKISKIFTLDKKEFHTYRIHGKKPFEIIPQI